MIEFIANIIGLTCISIILYQSYNLILGYGGLLHVGHIAFMAIGAYTSALLTTLFDVPVWIGILSATLLTAVFAMILAIPTVRFREDYLVAATLGMSEIIRLFIINERDITGGSFGIIKIPRPSPFGIDLSSNVNMTVFLMIITVLTMLIIWRIVSSPYGRSLEAVREDEVAAAGIGKNVRLKKVQILVIGAIFAGLSGALFAHTLEFIDPSSFALNKMTIVLLAVMMGGSGTFWGPIVATIILSVIFESMRFLPFPSHVLGPFRLMLYSALLIVIMIFKPEGIIKKRFKL